MTSIERFENCLEIGQVKDRRDIPIYPMLLTFPGTYAGYTQKQIIDSPAIWMKALSKVWKDIGKPDVCLNTCPGDSIFGMQIEVKRPGYELDDNEQYQFIEKPQMDIDDYQDIIKNGYAQWNIKHLGRIQKPPKSSAGITLRWIKLGINCGRIQQFLKKNDIAPIGHAGTYPAFDALSMSRSFEPFITDIYEYPDIVKAAIKRTVSDIIPLTLKNIKRSKGNRAILYAMRSSMDAISPSIFDEFSFPYLSELIMALHKAGVKSVIHADGNWLPIIDRFLKLPRASVHFELDGRTDIFKASEILDGHHSIRGDVPAAMLAFGTYDEVRNYCEKLITGIGMKGGFMLGSGCEVPLNAKVNNIKAMFDSLGR